MSRTLYDVMMLTPAADERLIRVVYRHLAKRYHPDVDASPEAAARMAELNEAYEVLGDRARKARYDDSIGMARAATVRADPAPNPSRGGPSPEQAGSPFGEAGPPPVNPAPAGSVLTFGRYRGWTLNQVGRFDRDYLEWLARSTMGRNYSRELDQLLRRG
jgi:curved DNA-binding protein CbpA